jgi:hypothetical protein
MPNRSSTFDWSARTLQCGQGTNMSARMHIGQVVRQNYTYDDLFNAVEEAWPQPTEMMGSKDPLLVHQLVPTGWPQKMKMHAGRMAWDQGGADTFLTRYR